MAILDKIVDSIPGLIIGLVPSYIFYVKSRHSKILAYTLLTQQLIHDSIAKIDFLEVLYNKHPISNLSWTVFMFGNRGNDTINGQEFVSSNLLRIEPEDGTKILGFDLISHNADNGCLVMPYPDGKGFTIQFDYLDKGDFAAVGIFHTGKSNDDLKVMGHIKGGAIKEERINAKEKLQIAWLYTHHKKTAFDMMQELQHKNLKTGT
ncbi:MAG: hypothetical protein ABFD46_13065 [Armatimonadota bacterium]